MHEIDHFVGGVEFEVRIPFLTSEEDGHARFDSEVGDRVLGEGDAIATLTVLDLPGLDNSFSEFFGHLPTSLQTAVGLNITAKFVKSLYRYSRALQARA